MDMRCNRCHRPMKGTTAYDGACECGGFIEATPLPAPAAFAEFTAQCVERVEDNPENWPEVSELPEADTSDLVFLAQYQRTIDADFELQ